ncbi:MAG: urease accessory protein UreF [Rhodocyclaceae bacterium]|nr:urease accessory protein UreF [Rhodocyclaceae bacterium]MDZ4216467.1 urease accessory protein UreF [Rhodocyclaceae bacterium]
MNLARLLQLASPALPVGAYTYSQGFEWAVEAGTVKDEATALTWLGDQLEWNLGRYEAPLLAQMMNSWKVGAGEPALDARYLASRETAELRAETLQMGYSLRRLLGELDDLPAPFMAQIAVPPAPTFAWVWSGVATVWQIPPAEALTAWLWSWAENQVMAALKAVPLGQAAGQRILLEIGRRIPVVVERAIALDDDNYSNFAPGFAIACARHETQYSRLFRS